MFGWFVRIFFGFLWTPSFILRPEYKRRTNCHRCQPKTFLCPNKKVQIEKKKRCIAFCDNVLEATRTLKANVIAFEQVFDILLFHFLRFFLYFISAGFFILFDCDKFVLFFLLFSLRAIAVGFLWIFLLVWGSKPFSNIIDINWNSTEGNCRTFKKLMLFHCNQHLCSKLFWNGTPTQSTDEKTANTRNANAKCRSMAKSSEKM